MILFNVCGIDNKYCINNFGYYLGFTDACAIINTCLHTYIGCMYVCGVCGCMYVPIDILSHICSVLFQNAPHVPQIQIPTVTTTKVKVIATRVIIKHG